MSAEERATRVVQPQRGNVENEQERIGAIEVRHRFVEAPGAVRPVRWHLVETVGPAGPALVLVHGHPFSWTYWKPLLERLGPSRKVVAVDLKGYGQSDKSFGDWRAPRVAEELLALCDTLLLDRFDLAAADRGTVLCDHLVSAHPDRVLRYVRVGAPNENELEGDHDYESWHREPLWASDMLRDTARYMAGVVEPQLVGPVDDKRWTEALEQFAFPGICAAVPRSFQETSFRKDREDRRAKLFPAMRCPVLDLRGGAAGRYVPVVPTDRVTPAGWQEQVIDKVGPYLMVDAAGPATDAIEHFLTNAGHRTDGLPVEPAAPGYVPAQPKPSGVPLVVNEDGEQEIVDGATVTHRFLELDGPSGPVHWHFIEAGDPASEPIVMLHGHPESWYGWHHQIARFAPRHRIVAPDLKGYGQSDKRPGDFRHEAVAEELVGLLDRLGLNRFNLFAHDRGAVQADYIAGNHPSRVLRYVRMQQIGHRLLPTNSPQERTFRDPVAGPRLFQDPKAIFDRMWGRFKMEPIPQERLDRMISEVSHPGFSDAVPRYFQSSSFQKELYDRVTRLFRSIRCPVLALQAGDDVGQPRWYYDDTSRPLSDHVRDLHLEFLDGAGHFTTVNFPERLTERIDAFLKATAATET